MHDGKVTCNQRQINSQLMQFYKELYTSDLSTDDAITQMLDGLELKGMEETDRTKLDQPFTVDEIPWRR